MNQTLKVSKTATDILAESKSILTERGRVYDSKTGERSMASTVTAFNAITGQKLTEPEGWLLLQILKDVRQWSKKEYHPDSALDAIGYAALKAESLSNEG